MGGALVAHLGMVVAHTRVDPAYRCSGRLGSRGRFVRMRDRASNRPFVRLEPELDPAADLLSLGESGVSLNRLQSVGDLSIDCHTFEQFPAQSLPSLTFARMRVHALWLTFGPP